MIMIRYLALAIAFLMAAVPAVGQSPVLETVFPAGGRVGESVDVAISGSGLAHVRTLISNAPGVSCEKLEPLRFRLSIPADVPPGTYDLWAVGDDGVSVPRTFMFGNRAEFLEVEPNESATSAMSIPAGAVINGRIDKGGDRDCFRFEARQGQRIVMECWAERIDSRLRAVLELLDDSGRRLAVNRGYFGIDPLIDFRVPADGTYIIQVQDLTSGGGAEHYYRLDIDSGPRVAFAVPSVITYGRRSRVTLFGWNLGGESGEPAVTHGADFDKTEIEIPEPLINDTRLVPVGLRPTQAGLAGIACRIPGSHASFVIGVTDVPVESDGEDNHVPASARRISCPCEVSGQLTEGDERDWFTFDAKRGEVFYFEAFAERIHSPVDLQIGLFDSSSEVLLARFGDSKPLGNGPFSLGTLDPAGRWVAPDDGSYLLSVQNLIGGLASDPRRVYRLNVRREDPDFQIVAVPHRDDPAGLNLLRGGRVAIDLTAIRRRGCQGAIRVSAQGLSSGVQCPETWFGPGVDRAMVVVSADRNVQVLEQELNLVADVERVGRRPVHGGSLVRSGTPQGWGRLVSKIPLAVTGDAPLRVTADGHETMSHHLYGKLAPRHSPGGVVDVAVQIERRDTAHQAVVKLFGIGLPDSISNQTTIVPAGETKGYLSFYLPPTLSEGRYSLVIAAETTIPTPDGKGAASVVVYSNPVTIDVRSAAFHVQIDPFAVTRARRGETIQVGYTAQRRNGFIGKMHTELAAPGRITDVVGLRGRGETFVGQTDRGSLQIIVNDDAPLGRQPFLRFLTIGVLEDEPVFQGSSFFTLEIVE